MQIRDLIPWGRSDVSSRRGRDPDNPVGVLQHDLNAVFEDFWSRFDQRLGGSDPLTKHGPSTDIVETDEAIEVTIELPGLEEKNVDVSLSDGSLTIRGEKKAESEEKRKGYYLAERSFGSFYRVIPLPPGVDGEKASARFRNGILTVSMPKTPEAQSKIKRIEVKPG